MNIIRRSLQVVAVLGTLLAGVVALALIVSQTAWFRDWLRGRIEREANQVLNAELEVRRLTGNLFFGVALHEIGLVLEGERVIAADRVGVNYNVFSFVTGDIIIDEIRVERPVVRLVEDEEGWNVGRLARAEEREAEREGPGRAITIGDIVVTNGDVTVDGSPGGEAVRVPERIRGLEIRGAFSYEPVHYTVELAHLSFRAEAPEFVLEELSGTFATRDDATHFEELVLRTAASDLRVSGQIRRPAGEAFYNVAAAADRLSLPEIGRIVPALAGVPLQPAFELQAEGPPERLEMDLDVRSAAGNVRGPLTLDIVGPVRRAEGDVQVEALDLGVLLDDPEQASHITGQAAFDLRFPDAAGAGPASPLLDRLEGTYRFRGPRVAVAGYEAREVVAEGRLDGPQITLDVRAAAYEGRVTAAGTVVRPADARPLAYDLRGRARDIDLRHLPQQVAGPRVASDLNLAYHVRGRGDAVSGEVTLEGSQLAGARLAAGTVGSFDYDGATVRYTARGHVTDLDLQRIGEGFDIAVLADPQYASRLTGPFDVSGRGTDMATLWLEARGELVESTIMGGRLPQIAYDARIEAGTLHLHTQGRIEGFDPHVVTGREALQGEVTGNISLRLELPGLGTDEVDLERMTVAGRVVLDRSAIGEVVLQHAVVDGRYLNRVGELTELEIEGPDVRAQASGVLALDETTPSDLSYRIDLRDLETVGRLLEMPLQGRARLDGRLEGNALELRASGLMDGSGVAYGDYGALDVNARYDVRLPELEPAQAIVQATTDATFVRLNGFELNEVIATTTYAGDRLEFDVVARQFQREIESAGALILHTDHQEIHLPRLFLRAEGVEWHIAPGADAAIEYGADVVRLRDVRLVSADQELRVQGELALAAAAVTPAPLEVVATNVDLAALDTLFLLDRDLGGRLDATATIRGSTEAPLVDARAGIRNGAVGDYRYDSLTAELQYTEDMIEVDARLQQSPAEWISAIGVVPMTIFQPVPADVPAHVPPVGRDRVDLRIESSTIGLGFVEGFTGAIAEVQGTLQANLHVTGSGQDPHVTGAVDIRGGAFRVPALGTAYRGLDTRLDLQEDVLAIERFQILDRQNDALTVEGRLATHDRQIGDFDVRLQASRFEILKSELGDVDVDAELRITGDLRRPAVVGEVSVVSGRIEVDRVLQMVAAPFAPEADGLGAPPDAGYPTRLREPGPVVATEVPPPAPPAAAVGEDPPEGAAFFDQLSMDVRVRLPNNLLLRGRDLRAGDVPIGLGNINLTMGGDVRMHKEAGEGLRLTGAVATVRGHYDFQGRRFEVLRDGTIRFVGLEGIDPVLDISARRRFPGLEAFVHIGGTLGEPELTLSSDPPQDEGDILAMIVFNQPLNQLGASEQVSIAQRAGALAAGFAVTPITEAIADALPLDFFEIEPVAEAGRIDPRITVGQRIGDRIFVRFTQQIGAQDISEFVLEYQLAEFLRLQTSIAEAGGSARRLTGRVERAGVDLIFFFSY